MIEYQICNSEVISAGLPEAIVTILKVGKGALLAKFDISVHSAYYQSPLPIGFFGYVLERLFPKRFGSTIRPPLGSKKKTTKKKKKQNSHVLRTPSSGYSQTKRAWNTFNII